MSKEISPLPWAVYDNGQYLEIKVPWKGDTEIYSHSPHVCDISYRSNEDLDGRADAAFIVKACNSHGALIAALQEVKRTIKESDEWWMDVPSKGGFDLDAINAALAAAGAE